jgi:hypothetical protein
LPATEVDTVVSPGRTDATNTGIIRWRADYGGAQDYTMFLPTQEHARRHEQGNDFMSEPARITLLSQDDCGFASMRNTS